jgi:plasmid stability protein
MELVRMATITIRKLDDAVVAQLKARAKSKGTSVAAEARAILTSALSPRRKMPRLSGEAAIDYLRARRAALFGDRLLPDSTVILRTVRYGPR